MSREIEIETDEEVLEEIGGGRDLTEILHRRGVMSLRLSGPLFFGGASQVSQFFKNIHDAPKVLILRMGYVPVVDATGANIIVEFIKKFAKPIPKSFSQTLRNNRAVCFIRLSWKKASTITPFLRLRLLKTR